MNGPLTPQEREAREEDDREAEDANKHMLPQEHADLRRLATDYDRRRSAMMRRIWRARSVAYRPSLRACAIISVVAVLVLLWT